MTHDEKINRHIADAKRLGERLNPQEDPIDLIGWRPTCYVLALEVERLREQLKDSTPKELRGQELLDAMDAHGKRVCATPESARAFLQKVGILDESGQLSKRYR